MTLCTEELHQLAYEIYASELMPSSDMTMHSHRPCAVLCQSCFPPCSKRNDRRVNQKLNQLCVINQLQSANISKIFLLLGLYSVENQKWTNLEKSLSECQILFFSFTSHRGESARSLLNVTSFQSYRFAPGGGVADRHHAVQEKLPPSHASSHL